jgi:hypothetical protein
VKNYYREVREENRKQEKKNPVTTRSLVRNLLKRKAQYEPYWSVITLTRVHSYISRACVRAVASETFGFLPSVLSLFTPALTNDVPEFRMFESSIHLASRHN